MNEKLLA